MVLRFLPSGEGEDQFFEVGLKTWLSTQPDDDMKCMTRWPPSKKPATQLVKVQAPSDITWKEHPVQVMRCYGKKSSMVVA